MRYRGRAHPALCGGMLVRLVGLLAGLVLCAAGIVALLEGRLGLAPWDVLHQGVTRHSPLSFGEATIVVGLLVLALAWRLGAQVGLGTVLNATVIGAVIQGLTAIAAVRSIAHDPLWVRVASLVAGLVLFGLGSALYIGAALGAGPRDSLMLVVAERTGIRLGFVRAGIELTAFGCGAALGGTFGVGTLAFALGIGPLVEFGFFLLGRSPLAAPEPLPPTAEIGPEGAL